MRGPEEAWLDYIAPLVLRWLWRKKTGDTVILKLFI